MHNWALWALHFLVCYVSLLLLWRSLGTPGLFSFMATMTIVGNLEVYKVVAFSGLPEPVALGTVPFCALYLTVDILNEYQGPAAARQAMWCGFASMLLASILLYLVCIMDPLTATQASGAPDALAMHQHLSALFLRQPKLVVATLASYLISVLCDISIFGHLRAHTHRRLLWLRKLISTIAAALIDSIIFNVLAWKLLAIVTVSTHTLWDGYIWPTFLLRLLVTVLDTPVIYYAGKLITPQRMNLETTGEG